MEYRELFTSSFEALSVNRLRTFLATLGIVIGITAVIALLSLGQAGQKSVESQIQALGSNLLTIIPGALRPGDIRSAAGTSTTLTSEDAEAIQEDRTIGHVTYVSAELLRRAQVVSGRNNTNTQVIGVWPTYQEARNLTMEYGTFLSQRDVDAQGKVAVLGPTVVTDLFGEGANPLGETIRINNISFRIVGITKAKGGSGFNNQDDIVYVPLTTAQKQLFGVDFIGSISVAVDSPDNMDEMRDQIGYLLLRRHKIADPRNADFTIFSQQDILGTAQQVTGIFTTLLAGIGAISLLVGGIGIMNVMLMSVIERTREIGLRKALGATRSVVIQQFLLEAVILTGVGGILGIVLGATLSFVVSRFINLPFVLSGSAVVIAVVVSSATGILFGWYPAKKAADLSPIEALRYE